MKPLACTLAAAAYARTVRATTPMLNRPDEPPAARRMNCPPSQPTASPIAAPAASSSSAVPASIHHDWAAEGSALRDASAVTRMTTGASLKPDSASSIPVIRWGSGTRRRTEKTAAASVEDRMAATSRAVFQSSRRTNRAASATTPTDTSTPTVESTAAGATERRMPDHRVLRPPSDRMRMSAEYPSTWVSWAESNLMPSPDSPMASPMAR